MAFIQFLIIGFSLLIISRIILSFKSGKISGKSLLFWLAIWLAIPITFLFPKVANYIAETLGLDKGADLAVSLSILLIFYLIFRVFVGLEKIENEITAIAREIALRNKDKK